MEVLLDPAEGDESTNQGGAPVEHEEDYGQEKDDSDDGIEVLLDHGQEEKDDRKGKASSEDAGKKTR